MPSPATPPPVRRNAAILAVVLVCAGLGGAALVGPPVSKEPPASDEVERPERLVSPDGETLVWPYTSRNRSASGRTLALNVVVRGDSERTRRLLTDRSPTNWTGADRDRPDQVAPWQPTHGATRYSYVARGRAATGRWVPADDQLQVGTYFGQRTHVRTYGGPAGNWTALQAHTEYWDWFRLRHTVTGVGTGAAFVADDLADERGVRRVGRTEHGFTGGGSDGRWTVVDLVPAALLGGLAAPFATRQLRRREVALAVGLVGLVLGVRAWGLAAEAVAPGLSPTPFAAVGYAALALGPPALAARVAPGGRPRWTALLAAVGLGLALVADLALVGVARVPDRLLFHRVALAAALGLVTLGAAAGNRRLAGAGLLAWLAALAAALSGVV